MHADQVGGASVEVYQSSHATHSKHGFRLHAHTSMFAETCLAAGQLGLQHSELATTSGPDLCFGSPGLGKASGKQLCPGLVAVLSFEGCILM
jgi:hypothetical protein